MVVNLVQTIAHAILIDPLGHIPFAGPVLHFILSAVA